MLHYEVRDESNKPICILSVTGILIMRDVRRFLTSLNIKMPEKSILAYVEKKALVMNKDKILYTLIKCTDVKAMAIAIIEENKGRIQQHIDKLVLLKKLQDKLFAYLLNN